MVIPIKCGIRDYFKYFTQCLNPVLRLKPRERDVLSVLLTVYHSSRHLEEDRLYNLMYNKNNRKTMRASIQMSEASFNNHISQLKKRKVIDLEGKLSKLLTDHVPIDNKLEITYSIYVN